MPHLVDLGPDARLVGRALDGAADWDALRTATTGPFALPADPAQWRAEADARLELETRMRVVLVEARRLEVRSIASYGVGSALPELWLHRLAPDIALTLTDVGPATVARLRTLFPEASVAEHDLRTDPPLPADLHVFHRIDTELTNRAWRAVLGRFRRATVVLVATDVLSPARMRLELRALPHRWRAGWQRAGWSRTEGSFESLWRRTHDARELDLGDLRGWLLTPRV